MSDYASGPFEVRFGKWGAYLWSKCGDEDMPLQRVADTLNGQAAEIDRLRADIECMKQSEDEANDARHAAEIKAEQAEAKVAGLAAALNQIVIDSDGWEVRARQALAAADVEKEQQHGA